MSLITDVDQGDNARAARFAIQNIVDIQAQQITNSADIVTAKATVKSDADKDVFNSTDLANLASKLQIDALNTTKLVSLKTSLTTLKPTVDAKYADEIQTEIDKL